MKRGTHATSLSNITDLDYIIYTIPSTYPTRQIITNSTCPFTDCSYLSTSSSNSSSTPSGTMTGSKTGSATAAATTKASGGMRIMKSKAVGLLLGIAMMASVLV